MKHQFASADLQTCTVDHFTAESLTGLQTERPNGPAQTKLHSDALFAGRVEVEIQHGAHTYRLRKTALGKLILTK